MNIDEVQAKIWELEGLLALAGAVEQLAGGHMNPYGEQAHQEARWAQNQFGRAQKEYQSVLDQAVLDGKIVPPLKQCPNCGSTCEIHSLGDRGPCGDCGYLEDGTLVWEHPSAAALAKEEGMTYEEYVSHSRDEAMAREAEKEGVKEDE